MTDSSDSALVSARVTSRESGSVTIYARSREITCGPPVSFDRTEAHFSAVEQFAAAIAADIVGGFRRLLERRRIAVDDLEAVLRAEIADPLVYLGVVGESGRPRMASLNLTVYLGTPGPAAAVEEAWAEARRRSPLLNTVSSAMDLQLSLQLTS